MYERQYTALSGRAWERIAGQDMSPSEAVRFFSELQPRTFGEVLSALMKLKRLDAEALVGRIFSQRDDIRRDSVRRRLSSWLSGGAQPLERMEFFQLCFALELEECEARDFLRYSQDGDFHLRDPREAGYLYGLRMGKTYGATRELLDRIPGVDGPFPAAEETSVVYTRTMADVFHRIHSDAEFRAYCNENRLHFGTLHNTAYHYFTHFFNELLQPNEPCCAEQDEAYSIEQAVDIYLRLGLPSGRKTEGYSPTQKAVKRLWPNATAIKNMRNRKIDISRKVLLLLYLVTEGLSDGIYEEAMGWEVISPEEQLEEHSWNIDLMLHECGLSPLDPRSPFDWLILYSLRTGGEEESMSDRLSAVLAALFSGEGGGRALDGQGDGYATLVPSGD